jgi:hypothetical protein
MRLGQVKPADGRDGTREPQDEQGAEEAVRQKGDPFHRDPPGFPREGNDLRQSAG